MRKVRKLLIFITLIFALSSGFFCHSVFAAEDVTQLQFAYDSAETAINTQAASPVENPYYEANSYQAFTNSITALGGLVGIQAVIDNPASLQADVDTLTSNINDALLALILDDTYYSTLANFSIANSIDLSPYTSDSQTLYNNEMNVIETILNTPTAGELAIQNLNSDISNASTLLVLRGDKVEMNNLVTQIEALYTTLGDDYIPSTFTEFKNSYDLIDTLLVTDVGKTLQEIQDNVDSTVPEVQAAESRLNEVIDVLILKPDKSQLLSDYTTALAIDSILYTTSSFTLFTNGLELIENVIDDLEALDTDVTQAIIDLTGLYSVLVVKGDITDLQTAYNAAINQDLSSYTPSSVSVYQSELDRINGVILSNDTDQNTTNQALTDLTAASSILVLKADKANLEILNVLLIDAYYEESELYTESSHNDFKDACGVFGSYLYINSVIVDDNETQANVDALEEAIQSALDLLVPLVGNTGLLTIYYELKDKDISGYTTNSQTAYLGELERLYQIIIGDELDSTAVEEVMLDLSLLNGLLLELPNYTELQLAYDSMDIYREEDYSASSYSILSSAKIYAEYMLSNLNATQSELDAAIDMLNNSVESLQQFIEPIYLRENNTLDVMKYITLGQSTVIDFVIGNPSIASVDSTGLIRGLSYGETFVTVNLSNGAKEVIEVNVVASVKLPVYIMTASIPIATVGLGSLVLFGRKEKWIKLIARLKKFLKKKQ